MKQSLNNKLLKNILSFGGTIILIGFLIWYILNNLESFAIIRQISLFDCFLILMLMFVNFLTMAVSFKIIMDSCGYKLTFKEWFGLTMITSMSNLFVPAGGIGFRAIYLKKIHGFEYTHFLSTFAALSIIDFILFGVAGLISILYIYLQTHLINWFLIIIFATVLLICLISLFFSPKLPRLKNKFMFRVVNVLESWYELKRQPKLILNIFLSTGVNVISSILIYFLAFHALGLNVSVVQASLPAAMGDYGGYIKILPGAVGFYEASIIYSAKVLGSTPAQGLIVAGIVRVAGNFWAISLGLIFSLLLVKLNKNKENLS